MSQRRTSERLSTDRQRREDKEKQELEHGPDIDYVCGRCALNYADDPDNNWIICSDCSYWFHYRCVGITKEPEKSFIFICPRCRLKRANCDACGSVNRWIWCNTCTKWFHEPCVGIARDVEFKCRACSSQ